MSSRIFAALVVVLYLAGAGILLVQPARGVFSPGFRGLPPTAGSEEAMYLLRTQEALLDQRFGEVSNGIWTNESTPPGMQMAGMEETIGLMFHWTGLSAPWIVLLLTILIAPLTAVFTTLLARQFGLPRLTSLLAGAIFFWLIAFARREFHPGFSMPLVLAGLLCLGSWWRRPRLGIAILAGAVLGWSMGAYFWSWTFLFATGGLLGVFAFVENDGLRKKRILTGIAIDVAALVTGFPTIVRMVLARGNPFFEETALRVGLVHSRALESPVRSMLIAVLAICMFLALRDRNARRRFALLLAMVGALAVCYFQQIVHGLVISFSSHYFQYVCLAAILSVAVIRNVRTRLLPSIAAVLLSLTFLAGAVHDYGKRTDAFLAPEEAHQHLASLLQRLRDGKRDTVLTDKTTADFIASFTEDDVVFTEYSEIVLISDEEYQERYCLSEAFAKRPLPIEDLVVPAEERLRVIRGQQTQEGYDKNLAAFRDRCETVKKNLPAFLAHYGVTVFAWDERRRPDAKPDEKLFKQIIGGDGWSLWITLSSTQTTTTSPATSR